MIYNSRNSKDLIVFLEVERSEDIYNSRNSKDLIVSIHAHGNNRNIYNSRNSKDLIVTKKECQTQRHLQQ